MKQLDKDSEIIEILTDLRKKYTQNKDEINNFLNRKKSGGIVMYDKHSDYFFSCYLFHKDQFGEDDSGLVAFTGNASEILAILSVWEHFIKLGAKMSDQFIMNHRIWILAIEASKKLRQP